MRSIGAGVDDGLMGGADDDLSPWRLIRRRRDDGTARGCTARREEHATGCEEARSVVDLVFFVGLLFNFTKPKWQTLGDGLLFDLAYILASCQITRFAKLILANSWRCSK